MQEIEDVTRVPVEWRIPSDRISAKPTNGDKSPMDGYEYPTNAQLKRVRDWKVEWTNNGKTPLYAPWFDYIKSLWWMPDWGWHEYDGVEDDDPVRVFHISTGGWSGNEDLIDAMDHNFICWSQSFYVHKRGGHFEFRIPHPTRRRRSKRRAEPPSTNAVDPVGGIVAEAQRATESLCSETLPAGASLKE